MGDCPACADELVAFELEGLRSEVAMATGRSKTKSPKALVSP